MALCKFSTISLQLLLYKTERDLYKIQKFPD